MNKNCSLSFTKLPRSPIELTVSHRLSPFSSKIAGLEGKTGHGNVMITTKIPKNATRQTTALAASTAQKPISWLFEGRRRVPLQQGVLKQFGRQIFSLTVC